MSLKDALLKAGFHSSKIENERVRKPKNEKTKVEKHQEQRNFCEVCETTQPDVELFKHRHPRIDAEWICLNCADKNEILDDFRKTAQSDHSKNRMYRRFYGHTRDFTKEQYNVKKDSRSGGKPHLRDSKKKFNNKKRSKPRYIIDEKGEKNFNC